MKTNTKVIIGVGAGLIAGYFLIKSKKPLYIFGMGLAGGLLANLIFKQKQIIGNTQEEKPKPVKEINDDLVVKDNEEIPSKDIQIESNVNQSKPSDYFEIDLGYNS